MRLLKARGISALPISMHASVLTYILTERQAD